jgi:hypothetical protein
MGPQAGVASSSIRGSRFDSSNVYGNPLWGAPHYIKSMEAHKQAVRRGANVTWLYAFRDRNHFKDASIEKHLSDLAADGSDIRIALRESPLESHSISSFLEIGRSLQALSFPTKGTSNAAVAFTDDDTVQQYIGRYGDIGDVARRLGELIKQHV